MAYRIKHHQIIESALENLNADFFFDHNIVFGGGTRIALELDEYRESVDIDFLCPNKESYKAVRNQVTNTRLGALIKEEFNYTRDIRFDRGAVRVWIDFQGVKIKMEFVSFDNYTLSNCKVGDKFPVPYLDKISCFYTKLLANADRNEEKDIFDLLAMYKFWGELPKKSIELAEDHYGVISPLIDALNDLITKPKRYEKVAIELKMDKEWVNDIVYVYPDKLLSELTSK